ncbi:MAG: helix-turn-helix domain-containing protein [Ktedonobacteraceae bacterium]
MKKAIADDQSAQDAAPSDAEQATYFAKAAGTARYAFNWLRWPSGNASTK